MAISNVSSNNRPGVCTSTTRPTAPFTGQVIFETDTKQTLVYQGSAWVMLTDADAPPGLQLVKTQTVGNGVLSVSVPDSFNDSFENYRITWTGGTMSAGADIGMQLIGLTSNGYYGSQYYDSYLGTAGGINRWNNTSGWQRVGGGDTISAMLCVDIFRPAVAAPTSIIFQGYVGNQFTASGAGIQSNSTAATGFILYRTDSPYTMTGGTIRVYGYRN